MDESNAMSDHRQSSFEGKKYPHSHEALETPEPAAKEAEAQVRVPSFPEGGARAWLTVLGGYGMLQSGSLECPD
jgi:hypothetical protein